MAEICQNVLTGFGTPAEWALSIVVQIFNGKDDTRNCSCYRFVKFLEHGMNMVERVPEKRLNRIVTLDEMHFGLMPERGTIDAVFILRRKQEEYHTKGKKLYMCLVDLQESVGLVIEEEYKKQDVLVRSVIRMYEGAKTRVRVDSELSVYLQLQLMSSLNLPDRVHTVW